MKKLLGITAASLLSASLANGGLINIVSDNANSTEKLASFAGSINYDGTSLLTITLTNTTSGSGITAAKLTGFVFNVANGVNATFVDANDLSTAGFDESALNNTDSESASPFGTFDEGAAIGADWTGGGSPNPGIDIGETGIFKFNITGGSGLLVEDFFTTDGGETSYSFLVRFKGINAGAGSDKVPAKLVVTPGNPIPLPPAAWSGIAMLGGMGAMTARRKLRSLISA